MQIMLLANGIVNHDQHSANTTIERTQTPHQNIHTSPRHLPFQIIIITLLEQVCVYRLFTLL